MESRQQTYGNGHLEEWQILLAIESRAAYVRDCYRRLTATYHEKRAAGIPVDWNQLRSAHLDRWGISDDELETGRSEVVAQSITDRQWAVAAEAAEALAGREVRS